VNPLNQVIPAKYRKYAYAVAFVLPLAFAAWQAADGNWQTFAAGVVSALVNALAHGNTDEGQ